MVITKVTIPHGLTSFLDGQLHLWMICAATHVGQLPLWMICTTTHIGQLPLWMICTTTHIGQFVLLRDTLVTSRHIVAMHIVSI